VVAVSLHNIQDDQVERRRLSHIPGFLSIISVVHRIGVFLEASSYDAGQTP